MHIQIFHNTYQQKGGEDAVVASELNLLQERGHKVNLHTISNNSIQGLWSKVNAAWKTSYSKWGKKKTKKIINENTPEIVHIHNFFPLLSPAVYDACRDARIPVIQTLHNYRTICAGALLMRDGSPCDNCIQGTPYQAVLHGCYRNSRLGSLIVARMIDYHRRQNTWKTKVDRFIALTNFSKGKFVEAGFPSEKIVVKPNFINVIDSQINSKINRNGALFVGRLSQEKGIRTLLKAWKTLDISLKIAGDGPLMNLVNEEAQIKVTAIGRKEPIQVAEEMTRAAFLVMPSEWYEGFPMTMAEAFERGLPVIASRIGSLSEIIEDGVNGLLFNPGDAEDLAKKVRWASTHKEEMRRMGLNARQIYEEKYSPDINYRQLLKIYKEAIDENQCRNARLRAGQTITHSP